MRSRMMAVIALLLLSQSRLRAQEPPAAATSAPQATAVFLDDFSGGDHCNWSASVGAEAACPVSVQAVQGFLFTGHVRFEGVVVTAWTADSKHLWVADSATAAAYNGIFVYRGPGAGALTVDFAVGKSLNIEGNTAEYDNSPPGDTLTELMATTEPEAVGTAGTPTPFPGTPADFAPIADGEPYEGVLVQLQNVHVTNVATGDRLTLTNGASQSIVMDDDIYNYSAATYPVGTCFASVTGIMSINLADDERRFLPRSVGDLVTGGSCLW